MAHIDNEPQATCPREKTPITAAFRAGQSGDHDGARTPWHNAGGDSVSDDGADETDQPRSHAMYVAPTTRSIYLRLMSDRVAPRERARRGLAVYFGVILVGSGICEGLMIATGEPITKHVVLVLINMWMPAVASLIARVVLAEGIRDVSFRVGNARAFGSAALKAWGYPLVVGGIAYGFAWLTGLAQFKAPLMASFGLGGASAPVRFLALLGLTMTIGVPLAAISAAGEELGWRGYMLTRLVDAGVPRPAIVSGVIWGLWHVPLIVTGQYASGPYPLLSVVLFMASTIPAGYVVARLRLQSGSIWPAVIFHSAWNSIIQGAFDGSTAGGSSTQTTSIWIGESGLLVVATSIVLALILSRGPWQVRRWPTDGG